MSAIVYPPEVECYDETDRMRLACVSLTWTMFWNLITLATESVYYHTLSKETDDTVTFNLAFVLSILTNVYFSVVAN